MKEMVCKYCQNEFCVNAQSPMRADYCPVPNIPGVCKHEERIKIKPEVSKMTPKECMIQALRENDVIRVDKVLNEIYETFMFLLVENDWEIVESDDSVDTIVFERKNEEKVFEIGQRVHIGAIGESKKWKFIGNVNHHTACYESVDGTMSATFINNSDWATIMRVK